MMMMMNDDDDDDEIKNICTNNDMLLYTIIDIYYDICSKINSNCLMTTSKCPVNDPVTGGCSTQSSVLPVYS